jgi:hypothetical protein
MFQLISRLTSAKSGLIWATDNRKYTQIEHLTVFTGINCATRTSEVFPGLPGDGKSRDGTGNDGKRDGTGKQEKVISRNYPFFPVPSRPDSFLIIFFTWRGIFTELVTYSGRFFMFLKHKPGF